MWGNDSCLYPAMSLTTCADRLSQSKEAHPKIDKVIEFNIIHMLVQLKDNLLSGGKCVPTILRKLSQPSQTPPVWHTLFLREFLSTFPHAPLYSVCGDFFTSPRGTVHKEFESKAQAWCKFAISINKNCESLYILCYVLRIYEDLFIIMGTGAWRPWKMTLFTSSSKNRKISIHSMSYRQEPPALPCLPLALQCKRLS